MAIDDRVRKMREGCARLSAEQTNSIITPTVINETMSRQFWPNESPLGQMFSTSNQNGPWRQVVGVVSDVGSGGSRMYRCPKRTT